MANEVIRALARELSDLKETMRKIRVKVSARLDEMKERADEIEEKIAAETAKGERKHGNEGGRPKATARETPEAEGDDDDDGDPFDF